MVLVVFLYYTDKKHIVINRNFRIAFRIDEQKTTVPVYLDRLALGLFLENPLECSYRFFA